MKLFSLILFCIAFFALCYAGHDFQITQMKETGELPSGEPIDRPLPKGVYWLLQPERHVFAGPQLTEDQFEKLVTDYPIDVVIRLNLEQKSIPVLDTAAERKVLARHGVKLYCFNIEGKGGQLNERHLRTIDELLLNGRAYVHCLHGKHRAKAVAGRYYAQRGYGKQSIYDMLDWWPVVRDHRYERYVAHVAAQTQLNTSK